MSISLKGACKHGISVVLVKLGKSGFKDWDNPGIILVALTW